MRKLPVLVTSLVLSMSLSGIATAATPVPPQSQAVQMQSGSVHFNVLTIKGAVEDRTAYLDQVLADWGWPGPNTMLLVLFPDANNDIRFAMGPGFRQNGLGADEMLGLIRAHYLSVTHQDRPDALQNLMQSVSKWIGADKSEVILLPGTYDASTGDVTVLPGAGEASQDVTKPASEVAVKVGVTKAWTRLRQNDAATLAAMASAKMTGEPGVVIAPMAKELANPPIAGKELAKALDAMLAGAEPEVVAYRSIESQLLLMVKGLNPVEITPEGGNPVQLTDLVQIALDRTEDGSWELLYIATDNSTFAETIKDWTVPDFTIEASTAPDKAASEFYTWYLAEHTSGRHPVLTGTYQAKVSPTFAKPMTASSDPFLCGQNIPAKVEVDTYAVFPTYALVTMKGGPWAADQWNTWQVKLVQENGTWLISDVDCGAPR